MAARAHRADCATAPHTHAPRTHAPALAIAGARARATCFEPRCQAQCHQGRFLARSHDARQGR
eukprot:13308967-Alexandrium_andersonii.AAC.1